MKMIEIIITDDTILKDISLVSDSAIEEDFYQFSNGVDMDFKIEDKGNFIHVTGPVMVSDKLIRRNIDGQEVFVYFSKDSIRKAAEMFFRKKTNLLASTVEHKVDFTGVVPIESWFLDENKKAPENYSNLPMGTWFITYKVENPEVIQLIKDGIIRGFSVEIRGKFDVKEGKSTDFSEVNLSDIQEVRKLIDEFLGDEEEMKEIDELLNKLLDK